MDVGLLAPASLVNSLQFTVYSPGNTSIQLIPVQTLPRPHEGQFASTTNLPQTSMQTAMTLPFPISR